MNQQFSVLILAIMVTLVPMKVHAAVIKVDGSSTVFPITEAVAEEFGKEGGDKVMVGISGTGGGFKRFCRGETDVSDASRPIKSSEVALCKENGIKYIEIPIAYDGLAVVVNPKNTWAKNLTTAELKKIWDTNSQGVVTKWSQVRDGFPDQEIRLFGPGTDSGTFDYFTEAINGKAGQSRGDYTASEDDNILVEGVASDPGGIGYFGLAYFEQNQDKLKLVPIDDEKSGNGEGPITPSVETVMDSTYQPLARPLFIYISTKAMERDEINKFVNFYLENSPALVEEVGYIPLNDEDYAAGVQRYEAKMTGSVFNKKNALVGTTMSELIAKPGK